MNDVSESLLNAFFLLSCLVLTDAWIEPPAMFEVESVLDLRELTHNDLRGL